MSKRKDRERAELEGPFRNEPIKEKSLKEDSTAKDPFKCFRCGNEISNKEAEELTKHAKSKPKDTVAQEVKKLLALGAKGTDRICTRCYKEKIESA